MSESVTPICTEYTRYTPSQRAVIMIGVMIGLILVALDLTIVNVAIPTMMGNLGSTIDQISWVSTGYMLSNVIFLPMTVRSSLWTP
jgi:DHA2 family multidrug resistance protein